jgi:lipoyl(octanoyl) transferase
MRHFCDRRRADTADEIWLMQHPPVYTLGLAGRREHVIAPVSIPIVHSDRGGQVTYHGPGQIIAYTLLDLRRLGIGPRELVRRLEQAVIGLLAERGIEATRRAGAPGVYVSCAKVAALGLRVRRGCSYHGLAVNVDLDLEPFSRINPCGYPGLPVTRFRDLGIDDDYEAIEADLERHLIASLLEGIDCSVELEHTVTAWAPGTEP